VVVVHHGDARGVAGRRALDQTNLRALSWLSSARPLRRPPRAAKTTGPLPPFRPTRLSTQQIDPVGLPHFHADRDRREP
jgi:hypothetical protein